MVIKKCDETGGRITVMFILESSDNLTGVFLVGDFNDWNPTAHPMSRGRNGLWWLSLDLEPNQTYRYRYCTAEGDWVEDSTAESFDTNASGISNAVVHTGM